MVVELSYSCVAYMKCVAQHIYGTIRFMFLLVQESQAPSFISHTCMHCAPIFIYSMINLKENHAIITRWFFTSCKILQPCGQCIDITMKQRAAYLIQAHYI